MRSATYSENVWLKLLLPLYNSFELTDSRSVRCEKSTENATLFRWTDLSCRRDATVTDGRRRGRVRPQRQLLERSVWRHSKPSRRRPGGSSSVSVWCSSSRKFHDDNWDLPHLAANLHNADENDYDAN